MTVYYNEHDPHAAQWLRNLMDAGLIPAGVVDERDIREVKADDVREFTQCHFFCGVGGWPYALHLAGWDPARPVWTGSCPCQPFSAAGRRRGTEDERHLWPDFARLIRECRPVTVLGEQVSSALGREWIAGVCADLEAMGYAFGAADLCAACLGAPHIRQRLFWVADTSGKPRQPRGVGRVEDGAGIGRDQSARGGPALGMEHAPSDGWRERWPEPDGRGAAGRCGPGGMDDPASPRDGLATPTEPGCDGTEDGLSLAPGPWSRYDLIPCRDGKARRVESGSCPLAPSTPRDVGLLLAKLEELGIDSKTARRLIRERGRNRVQRLKGYGNAIVPPVAAIFVKAFLETQSNVGSEEA